MVDGAPILRLRAVRPMRGPNLWGVYPAAVCEVEVGGSLARRAPEAVPGLEERLSAVLPGLPPADQAAADDVPAAWAALVGRVAVALQTLAVLPVTFIRVRPGMHGDPPRLAVGCAEPEVGVESLYEAEALLLRCLRGEDADVERVLPVLRQVHHDTRPRATAAVLIQAARRRGIPVRRDPQDPVFQLGLGRSLRRLDATMTDFTSVIATDITSDKDRTKRILARAGLPVPDGGVAETEDDAAAIARRLGFPVLLKPLDANDGRGISGRLETEDAVRAAFPIARAEHPQVVVERFAAGRDHRVVVVAGRVVAVAERIPARVTGDGRRTIRELAEATTRTIPIPRSSASPWMRSRRRSWPAAAARWRRCRTRGRPSTCAPRPTSPRAARPWTGRTRSIPAMPCSASWRLRPWGWTWPGWTC
jgi:cyanophycin synthetase